MIRDEIQEMLKRALTEMEVSETDPILEHPAEKNNGDYASNVALVQGKTRGISPRECAEDIVSKLRRYPHEYIERIEVAGPGFINFYFSKSFFAQSIADILASRDRFGRNTLFAGKKVMIEYTDPNPFKVFHIGHLMTNTIGESLAYIFEFSGADVKRANYQGDVGLHVAKAIAAKLRSGAVWYSAADIGVSYMLGEELFARKPAYVAEINRKVYEKSDAEVNDAYEEGRDISLAAFEEMYALLGTKFDYYFFESEVAEAGKKVVEEYLDKDVFEKSEGAVIFRGEKYGLHTRVFLTKEGLPPYEAKDLALAEKKYELYPYDLSLVVTASEQNAYYAVVRKAMSFIFPDLAEKTVQIGHGMMRVASGKMSSRKGNVITGESLVRDAITIAKEKIKNDEADEKEKGIIANRVGVGALKFAILKQHIRSDITYDAERSFSLEGDSGPYVQYAVVRARSVLAKAREASMLSSWDGASFEDTDVARLLYRFPEVVFRASEEHELHGIATYLLELAGSFNAFYATHQIVNDEPQAPCRLALTEAVSIVLANGLHLLGISVPDRM